MRDDAFDEADRRRLAIARDAIAAATDVHERERCKSAYQLLKIDLAASHRRSPDNALGDDAESGGP